MHAAAEKGAQFLKERTGRIMPKNDDEYSNVTRLLYCGGLSQLQYVRRIVENVACADLVSDFPAQMIHRKFPTGSLIGNRTFEELQQADWYALCTFENLRSKTGHSIISKHKCIELAPADIDGFMVPVEIDNGRISGGGSVTVYSRKSIYRISC